MDYEKKYNEALERAKKFEEKYGGGYAEYIFPELRESEDEGIRKLLVWQVYRNIEDETNDLAQSVYDGIKGHDPDIEESIEDWKRCLAWLEKQKEQKPVDYEHEMWKNCEANFEGGKKEVIEHPEKYGLQKPAEWSEEDERKRLACIETINEVIDYERERWEDYNPGKPYRPIMKYDEQVDWLKSLRPSWKPSEEQMKALEAATVRYQSTGLESLYEDLKKL